SMGWSSNSRISMSIGTSAPPLVTAKARGSAPRGADSTGSNSLRIKGIDKGVKETGPQQCPQWILQIIVGCRVVSRPASYQYRGTSGHGRCILECFLLSSAVLE